MFDSLVWSELRQLDRARPVYVEAESKKIGNLRVPEAMIAAMWDGQCVRLEADAELRVAMLKDEYRHFVSDPLSLGAQLDCLTALYGQKQIDDWKSRAAAGEWDRLVRDLLENHYDPAYLRFQDEVRELRGARFLRPRRSLSSTSWNAVGSGSAQPRPRSTRRSRSSRPRSGPQPDRPSGRTRRQ